MQQLKWILACAGALVGVSLATGSALADDRADCVAGIAMIKEEMAKSPPQATATALQRALRGAERELKEQEFDECIDHVADAKKALKR